MYIHHHRGIIPPPSHGGGGNTGHGTIYIYYTYVIYVHISIYIYTYVYIYIYVCKKDMATGVCIDDDDDARLSSAGIGSGHASKHGSKAIQIRDEAPIPRAKLISKKEKHSMFGLPICLFNWSL